VTDFDTTQEKKNYREALGIMQEATLVARVDNNYST
jgi:hypothetical protein